MNLPPLVSRDPDDYIMQQQSETGKTYTSDKCDNFDMFYVLVSVGQVPSST